jgi:hypothetical protein
VGKYAEGLSKKSEISRQDTRAVVAEIMKRPLYS